MSRLTLSLILALTASVCINAQCVDSTIMLHHSPSVVCATYEVCRHVSLSPEKQQRLAKALEDLDAATVEALMKNDGYLTAKDAKRLEKRKEKTLADILDREELEQYYRGIFNAEALTEGNAVANRLRATYGLTDQNWKFIRNAFYKIGLDSRVIRKVMADTPRKADKEIADLREAQLKEIEERGGIRVNDDMTVTETRPFKSTGLRKE